MLGPTQDVAAEPALRLEGCGHDRTVRRLAQPRILIVGCGDVGLRLVARLVGRYRVHALTHSPDRVAALRDAGALPIVADLDARRSLDRIASIAPVVVHLAPPPSQGPIDTRTRALCAALRGVRRLIYISTAASTAIAAAR